MKRSCFLWTVCLLWCAFPGLSPAQGTEQTLRECMEAVNSICPYDLGAAGKMTGARYDGKEAVFDVDTSSGIIKLSALSTNPKLLKQSLMMNVAGMRGDANATLLFRVAAECGAGVTYHYHDDRTGDDVSCSLSPDELATVLRNGVSDEELFEINIEMTNLNLPQEINGLVARPLVVEGNKVVYVYEMGPGMSLASLRQNAGTVRRNLLQGLPRQDPAGVNFVKLCARLGKEFVFCYSQGTDVFNLVLTNAELRGLLPQDAGVSSEKKK